MSWFVEDSHADAWSVRRTHEYSDGMSVSLRQWVTREQIESCNWPVFRSRKTVWPITLVEYLEACDRGATEHWQIIHVDLETSYDVPERVVWKNQPIYDITIYRTVKSVWCEKCRCYFVGRCGAVADIYKTEMLDENDWKKGYRMVVLSSGYMQGGACDPANR